MSISLGGIVKVRLNKREEVAEYIRRFANDLEAGKINSFTGSIGIDGIDGKLEVVLPANYITVLIQDKKFK